MQIDITFDPTNLGMKWNFIGNPYPSAIDFVAFQLANSAIIDGAAYFWSQATPPSEDAPGNSKLNLSQNDYAVFTIGTGGVAGGGPDTPNGYIASGQGFFIPAINRGTATFTNAIRMADNTSNNKFFKQSRSKSLNAPNPLENKLWVNLTSDNGVFQQILVGYVDGATNGNDGLSYDAPKVLQPNFAAALYSHIENDNTKYVIQGKDPQTLSPNEVITLGFINTMSSPALYTFSIDHLQGAFLSSHNIYLKDHALNTLHNLSESGYSFTSAVGAFNNRFELVFQDKALFTAQNHLKNNMLHIMQLNNQQVQFKTAENLNIKTIVIFDVLGRPLYHLKGHSHSETYRLSHLKQTVYIIKTTLSNGAIITKKMVKN
ncbi:T9SS type A sorting domain-containing protein [Algibacter mikhailovii]|uniref:T9SS type A sorting domain-containing protein n=1 Tax=Algibacter mikhailovii TaxID=425498 RepID=A0A918R439_9FLAO|nr:T9SS type A sorting domain-containing protein [Algibacter mikhailovii]GGZ84425.1 hypothetical protein GCM10007028_22950 [Algibacter mikhailovii]